jgi:hypothetical protein
MSTTVVWKYKLQGGLGEPTELQLPSNAHILSAGLDPRTRELVIWARVNPAAPLTPVLVLVVGTGQELPDKLNVKWVYVSTVGHDMPAPPGFVWHVFVAEPIYGSKSW